MHRTLTEPLREKIGSIAFLLNDGEYLSAGFSGDFVAAVHHAGDGCDRNTGKPRDIIDIHSFSSEIPPRPVERTGAGR